MSHSLAETFFSNKLLKIQYVILYAFSFSAKPINHRSTYVKEGAIRPKQLKQRKHKKGNCSGESPRPTADSELKRNKILCFTKQTAPHLDFKVERRFRDHLPSLGILNSLVLLIFWVG